MTATIASPKLPMPGLARNPDWPTPIAVPRDISARLLESVAEGTADAAAWAARHPAGTPEAFDRATFRAIPAPPTGHAAERDLQRVRDAIPTRTDAGTAFARAAHENDGWPVWDAALREISRTAGARQARHAADLVQRALDRSDGVSDEAKEHFNRLRPFQEDPSITPLVTNRHGNASYPSGHATGAFAAAVVLASFLPSSGKQLLEAAAQVAYSRVYAGVHHPTDLYAGARIASAVATDVLRRGTPAHAS